MLRQIGKSWTSGQEFFFPGYVLNFIHSLLYIIFHWWLSLSDDCQLQYGWSLQALICSSPREDKETAKLIICGFHHKQLQLKTLCRLPIKTLCGSRGQNKKVHIWSSWKEIMSDSHKRFSCVLGSHDTLRCNVMSAWKSLPLPLPLDGMAIQTAWFPPYKNSRTSVP